MVERVRYRDLCRVEGVWDICLFLILQGHPGKEGPSGEKGAQVSLFQNAGMERVLKYLQIQ